MKTDIVKRLRAVDHTSVEDCFLQSYLFSYAADEIERLREALKGAQVWREIESAPHDVTVLLGWHDWRDSAWIMEVGRASWDSRSVSGYSNMSRHGSATHWMPLPAAPSKEHTT